MNAIVRSVVVGVAALGLALPALASTPSASTAAQPGKVAAPHKHRKAHRKVAQAKPEEKKAETKAEAKPAEKGGTTAKPAPAPSK
jgi:hypothetical protein